MVMRTQKSLAVVPTAPTSKLDLTPACLSALLDVPREKAQE
jgi:hypothetical protein